MRQEKLERKQKPTETERRAMEYRYSSSNSTTVVPVVSFGLRVANTARTLTDLLSVRKLSASNWMVLGC